MHTFTHVYIKHNIKTFAYYILYILDKNVQPNPQLLETMGLLTDRDHGSDLIKYRDLGFCRSQPESANPGPGPVEISILVGY